MNETVLRRWMTRFGAPATGAPRRLGAAWVLEDGMIFHIYTLARGIAFSETILVVEDGAERRTKPEHRFLNGARCGPLIRTAVRLDSPPFVSRAGLVGGVAPKERHTNGHP